MGAPKERIVTSLFDAFTPLVNVVRKGGNTTAGRAFEAELYLVRSGSEERLQRFTDERITPMVEALRKSWKARFLALPRCQALNGGSAYTQFLADIGPVRNRVPQRRACKNFDECGIPDASLIRRHVPRYGGSTKPHCSHVEPRMGEQGLSVLVSGLSCRA